MKYDELDAAILSAIRGGVQHFYLLADRVRELSEPHSLRGDGWRVVDRRLQALRKSGRIAFDHKQGWRAL